MIGNVEVPVLLVRPGEQGAPVSPQQGKGQIIVPLDGSPLAEEVLEPAAELAKALDAELTLLQVVQPAMLGEGLMLPVPSAYDQDLTERSRDQAQDYVRSAAERLRGRGLRASGVAVIGWNTATTILSLARPEHTSLIAVATHGRSGFRRLVLGSVADKLIRGADVPVLVYHPSKISQLKPGPSRRRSVMPGDGRQGASITMSTGRAALIATGLGLFIASCDSGPTAPSLLNGTYTLVSENDQPLPSDPGAPFGCCLTLSGSVTFTAGVYYLLEPRIETKTTASRSTIPSRAPTPGRGIQLHPHRRWGRRVPLSARPWYPLGGSADVLLLYGDEGPGSNQIRAVFRL